MLNTIVKVVAAGVCPFGNVMEMCFSVKGTLSLSKVPFSFGASGMTRSVMTDAVNRGAKANREVTGRV
jgi:hypothetical protein